MLSINIKVLSINGKVFYVNTRVFDVNIQKLNKDIQVIFDVGFPGRTFEECSNTNNRNKYKPTFHNSTI